MYEQNSLGKWMGAIIIILIITALLVWTFERRKEKKEEAPIPQTTVRTEPMIFEPHEGWYNGKKITVHDFGPSSSRIGSLYVLVTGFNESGNPVLVEGQNDIFDSKRDNPNYSDFWEIKFVTVPEGYEANSIKTAKEIIDKNFPIKLTGTTVDQPQVLEKDTISPDQPKLAGWADGEKVFSWRLDNNVRPNPDEEGNVATSTAFILITGFDENKIPILVAGQQNIIGSVPGDPDYSPLKAITFVEVPSDYITQTMKSAEDATKSGYKLTDSGSTVNLPVYSVEGKTISNSEENQANDEEAKTAIDNKLSPQTKINQYRNLNLSSDSSENYPLEEEKESNYQALQQQTPVTAETPVAAGQENIIEETEVAKPGPRVKITINGETIVDSDNNIFPQEEDEWGRSNDRLGQAREKYNYDNWGSNFPFN